jgi:hypothetical protein
MRTICFLLFVVSSSFAMAADSPCVGGRCVKNTVSATKQVVKTSVRPVRRVFRGR